MVGYLEAIKADLVIGTEKDEYIHVAYDKAQHLKHFVESLFEWVKLDAKEQILHFEFCDLNELTRNIVADWIPVLESSGFEYEIDIPETKYTTRININAYTRILNNILQMWFHIVKGIGFSSGLTTMMGKPISQLRTMASEFCQQIFPTYLKECTGEISPVLRMAMDLGCLLQKNSLQRIGGRLPQTVLPDLGLLLLSFFQKSCDCTGLLISKNMKKARLRQGWHCIW